MAKVLKVGEVDLRKSRNWKSDIVCKKRDEFDPHKGCGATLRITRRDFVLMYHKGDFARHHYVGVKCPACGKYVYAGRDVPRSLIDEFMKRARKDRAIFDGVIGVV